MSLLKFAEPTILNSKGQPIVLTEEERYHAEMMQQEINRRFYPQLKNALGYEIPITTLTTIMKKVSEQKFFEIAPADYLPVVVGEGAWSSNLTTYRSFSLAEQFETGIINTGGGNARLAVATAGVDALNRRVFNWAKSIGWSIFELQQAAKAGNWDLVTSLEKSRKMNWDLGIQRVAFLGAEGNNAANGTCLGLLNQPGITVDATLITKPLKSMSPTELKAFQEAAIERYRANCNRTAWPTHFIIPESDYNGLASQSSENFPIKSVLALLEEAFQLITRNKNFKILPLAYGDANYNNLGVQRYVFLRYDDESIRMDVPVDYTNTLANSIDNFSFQNAGYGQFTGAQAIRPLELLYAGYTPTP